VLPRGYCRSHQVRDGSTRADEPVGQNIGCVMRNFGTDWSFGRQRGVDLSLIPRSHEGPQQHHLLVAMAPDQRHPVKAGAHRAPPLRG